ncbi:MAG: hypothetical protein U0174_23385 [Polyangiaceae bacterium]
MTALKNSLGCALFLSALLSPLGARAAECGPDIASSCLDPDHVWPTGQAGAFLLLPRADIPRGSIGSLRAATTYIDRPLLVSSPGGGPEVNTNGAVSSRFTTTLGGAVHFGDRLAVDGVIPIVWGQNGSGAALVTGGSTLPTTAISDLRLGATVQLWRSEDFSSVEDAESGGAWSVRLGMSLPTGVSGAFAGGTSVVVAPSTSFIFRKGRLFGTLSAGARFREKVDFLDLRLGQELMAGFGGGLDILNRSRLSVVLETQTFLVLHPQRNLAVGPAGVFTGVSDRVTVPTEWHLGVRSAPVSPNWAIAGGFGTAIPFGEGTAVGTPAYRFSLRVEAMLR